MFDILLYILVVVVATAVCDSLVAAPIHQACSGHLTIKDMDTDTVLHYIKTTTMDVNIGQDKEDVVVSQTGNCCHHVFSRRSCRGEWLTIGDNSKYKMKYGGHISVIKSDPGLNGSCRSVRELKKAGLCSSKQKPSKGRMEMGSQLYLEDTTSRSLQGINEVTAMIVMDVSNSKEDIHSHPVTHTFVADSKEKLSLAEEEKDEKLSLVEDEKDESSTTSQSILNSSTTSQSILNYSTTLQSTLNSSTTSKSTTTSPISCTGGPPVTLGSVAAVCILLAVVMIFVLILFVCSKNNHGQCCLHKRVHIIKEWSPVSKEDFSIDMDNIDFDDKSSIITEETEVLPEQQLPLLD